MRMGRHAREFDPVAGQPPLHGVPARDRVEDNSRRVVHAHRERSPVGDHCTRKAGRGIRERGHVLGGPRFPDPGGVIEAPGGDPFAVRAERHVENDSPVTQERAEWLALRQIPEHSSVWSSHATASLAPSGLKANAIARSLLAAKDDPGLTRGDRQQHDVGVLHGGKPAPVRTEGERRVLETGRGAAPVAEIVDRDPAAIGPVRRRAAVPGRQSPAFWAGPTPG